MSPDVIRPLVAGTNIVSVYARDDIDDGDNVGDVVAVKYCDSFPAD